MNNIVIAVVIVVLILIIVGWNVISRWESMTRRRLGHVDTDNAPTLAAAVDPYQGSFNIGATGMTSFRSAESFVEDFDEEFTKSREHMGANTSGQYSSNRAALFTTGESLGKKADDEFDGDRAVTLGRRACKPCDASTIKLLYTDVMELETQAGPAADDCEYMNATGYVYKEHC
jgi:hypothetical protein